MEVGLEKRVGRAESMDLFPRSVRLSLSFTGWMEINRIWPVFLAFHGRSTEQKSPSRVGWSSLPPSFHRD